MTTPDADLIAIAKRQLLADASEAIDPCTSIDNILKAGVGMDNIRVARDEVAPELVKIYMSKDYHVPAVARLRAKLVAAAQSEGILLNEVHIEYGRVSDPTKQVITHDELYPRKPMGAPIPV